MKKFKVKLDADWFSPGDTNESKTLVIVSYPKPIFKNIIQKLLYYASFKYFYKNSIIGYYYDVRYSKAS